MYAAAADVDVDDGDEYSWHFLSAAVSELASEHRSTGGNRHRSPVVEKTVLPASGVDVAQVCRPSPTVDKHSLQPRTSTSAGVPASTRWRGTLCLSRSYIL